MDDPKTIRIAAIQSVSLNGAIAENLSHAEPLVEEARRKGAQIVLLPEFFSTGFEMSAAIWDAAEPSEGPTVGWLRDQARKHAIWIGTSFLEAAGNRFFNTFVLMDAKGNEAARIRKGKPAAIESYFFEGDSSSRVIETPFGRIGISICYESFFATTLQELAENGADLLLIPMSAPTPTLNLPLTQSDLEEYNEAIRKLAATLASDLGIPVVMANKTGRWKTTTPKPFPDEDSSFPGLSTIADSDGSVIAAQDHREGVIVGYITLNPRNKKKFTPSPHGKWAHKPPKIFKLFVISESLGKLSYQLSLTRRRKAAIKSKQA